MSDQRRRILDMLAEGKISAEEAERLLDALGRAGGEEGEAQRAPGKPSYLRVLVMPKEAGKDQVNIRVPLGLIRAGMKFGALMPGKVKEKVGVALEEKGIGVDLSKMSAAEFEGLVSQLTQMSIDVDDEKEQVRIFCE